MNIETIQHLFWECPHTQHFWQNINKLISNFGTHTLSNYATISLGLQENTNSPKTTIINFIIIMAKYFIFKCKYAKQTPSYVFFKNVLHKRIEIEKQIAFNKDKLHTHDMKWGPFLRHLI